MCFGLLLRCHKTTEPHWVIGRMIVFDMFHKRSSLSFQTIRMAIGFAIVVFISSACYHSPGIATSPETTYTQNNELSVATRTFPIPTRLLPSEIISPENAKHLELSAQIVKIGANSVVWINGNDTTALSTLDEITIISHDQPGPSRDVRQIETTNPRLLISGKEAGVLAWADGNIVNVWDTTDGSEITAHEQPFEIIGLALSDDGKGLAISTLDSKIKVWDLALNQIVQEVDTPGWMENLSYSPQGTYLGGVELSNFAARIINLDEGQLVGSYHWEGTASPALYSAHFSPDWITLAWVARGTVQLMDVESGNFGLILSHEDFVNTVSWSPDSRLLATSAAGTVNGVFLPLVTIWDVTDGQVVNILELEEPAVSLAFSLDGRELAVLSSSGILQIWKLKK